MYMISAVARTRCKWFFICILVMFIIVYMPLQSDIKYPRKLRNDQNMLQSDSNDDDNYESIVNTVHGVINEEEREVTKNSNATPQLYFVNNAKCKIPYINPFEPDVMENFRRDTFETCTNQSDLVRPIYDMNRKQYVLQIDENIASQILNSHDIEYNCYYQEITRNANHDSYNDLLPQIYFSQGYVVPMHVQALILACHEAANTTNILQRDAYALIQYKPQEQNPKLKKTTPRKPSVLMFGIDSLSRINLRRAMPKVYKFLTRRGWYEMQGYNKVADNTFPNLLAILSGYSPKSAKEKVCDTDNRGCLDRMPFIWKYFKSAGYTTAFAEDECYMQTFNYQKPGFVETPTDYYHRPFLKGFMSEMKIWNCANCTLTYCIGRRIQSSYVYDFGRDFAKRYIDERPIWGLFWSSSFSHDDYAMPAKMENYVLQYLLDFQQDGVFEQSIVIFLSDHGSRYGYLSDCSSGFLEERLPTMFIYLPPWFRAQYPQYAEALEMNQNRLTSNFDIHNTLKHIAELGQPPNSPPLPRANDCPKCQSLFQPVSRDRECKEAAIPEHYCTCEPYKRIGFAWSDRISLGVIDRINDYLYAKNFSSICANLTLSYIHKTEIKLGLDISFHEEIPKMDVGYYRVKFKVQQNGADFMATVLYNNVTNYVDVDVEKISRTNSYEESATCISHKLAKLYCICKSLLKP
ncbi:uncharacterized protein LOC133838517 [Drosophila sulfurigaster albostrigata]|uniref:uncharacterized protein LOC133838517 n=1 Tax=Drosophila sulfurigaster albostrigata TaxID=89887 RepID=UPI002D21CDF2|nr:uncharacterized protein LOC133838517 [Drosophila sulfurigaster albostrigata]